jgi:type IV pilus assembly protein PilM
MAQKYLGVDLGSHDVKIVLITAGLRGAAVLASYEERVTPRTEEDPFVASLRTALEMIRERGLAHLPTGIALPGTLGSYRVMQFPFADHKRIAQAVTFEVEGQFPIPVVELRYDHLAVPAASGGRALVAALRQDVVETATEAFRRAGSDIRVITLGPIALAQAAVGRVAALPPGTDETQRPAALLIDIGERSTEIVAVTDKLPVAVRTIRRGGRHVSRALQKAYGFDAAGVEIAKERDAFLAHAGLGELQRAQRESAEHVARAFEPIVREIEHTRLWLATEYDCTVTELRITGGTAELKGLQPFLQEQIGLPTHFLEPGDAVGVRALAGTRWTRFSVALGAALAAAKRPLVQLYDVTGSRSDGDWLHQRFMTLVSLGVAIVAFAAADTIVKVKAAQAQRAHQLAELETASSKIFGVALSSLADVESRLAEVEGADLTAQLPDRGAFEVLEMIVRAAAATDGGATAAPVGPLGAAPSDEDGQPTENTIAPGGITTATNADGSTTVVDPSGSPIGSPPGASPPPVDPGAGPVDPTAGIVASDQLVIQRIDIRELKIEMQVEATRATAQDRLALKLQGLGCVTDIKKGKVRDSNEKKVFEMEMSHSCFRAAPVDQGGA